MNHVAKKDGFTLIELMLAMTFISVLLLAIAMTIIQIGTIYNRGMTLKEVNQTGRALSDELRRNIMGSESFTLDTRYVTTSTGGRLCLGQYSYVWNYAKSIEARDNNLLKYADETVVPGKPATMVRLVKIVDPTAIYCAKNSQGAPVRNSIPVADKGKVTDLLKVGDRTLSIHQFAITTSPSTTDTLTGQQLYQLSFIIGTGNVTALNNTQSACLPPSDPNSDLAYCAVQQFNLVVRAGNRVN